MKDSLRFSVLLFLVLAAPLLFAQKDSKKAKTAAPPAMPNAQTRFEKPKQYTDSAEFDKVFKEFYPLVKPKETIRNLAEKQLERQLTAMIKQGGDSTEIIKAAYIGLEENAAYKIYHETYREKLSAKELKAYMAFIKTPEGAKVQSVTAELNRAPADVNTYITKTINTNLTPMRTVLREKTMKEQKVRDQKLMSDTTEAGRMYRQQMQLRDSIMKSRGSIQPKAPDVKAPDAKN